MVKQLLSFLILMSAFFNYGNAQDRRVTGTVLDENSDPLPGVNIVIKGTTTGTVSDVNGKFSINVDDDESTLVFSSVGYVSEEVQIGNQSVLDINLTPNIEQLGEIVVVGYGEMKRSDLTGSVVSVKGEDLQINQNASFDQALQGRAAGVNVTQTSGQPGGGVSVQIRGASSITRSSEPLYVIDGIPVSGESGGTAVGFAWAGGGNGQTAVNGLSAINMNDIESIEVLKDASATAIYGSRAANGVILITTKKGKSGKTKVNYDGSFGIQDIPKRIDVFNLQQYAIYHNEISEEYGFTPRPEFGDPSVLGEGTDWQEEIFEPSPMHNHNLSLSGGSKDNTFALSFGYLNQDGIVVGSGFERLSARLSIDNKSLDWLNFGGNFSVGSTNEDITLNDDILGVTSLSLLQTPDIPVRFPSGEWGGSNLPENTRPNPVAMATIRDMRLDRTRIMSNLYANIDIVKGLKFHSKFGTDINFEKNYAFNPTYTMGNVVNNQSQSRRRYADNRFWIFTNYLSYKKEFNNNISADVMLGTESQKSEWEGIDATRKNFVTNYIQELNAGDASTATNQQYKDASSLLSYYGRMNLSLFDRYLLTATYRADGSSKFGPNNKWGYFPSFAFAWKISNETFMENLPVVESLKFRAGYGEVGNQDIGNYTYGSVLSNYETRWGTGLLAGNFANPNVQWESTTSYNLGLDISLINNRIELIADVYLRETDNLLMPLQLPLYMGTSGTGSINSPVVNVGEMENRGLELTLNTVNLSGDLVWKTGLTFSMNKNKIVTLNNENSVIDRNVQWFNHVTRSEVGKPLGQFYGYVVEGIFEDAEDIASHATQNDKVDRLSGVWPGDLKFKDLNEDGVIDEQDRTFIGNPQPKFVYGINNNFTYKNFDLTIFIVGKAGNDLFNYTRRSTEGMNLGSNQLIKVQDRAQLALVNESGDINDVNDVRVVNPNTNIPRAVPTDPNNNIRISDRFVEDGSFLRIKNISLGYSFPDEMLNNLRLSSARLFVNLQNIYTFTDYSGFDPEIGPYNQDPLLNGVDNGNYPLPKIYTVGVNLSF